MNMIKNIIAVIILLIAFVGIVSIMDSEVDKAKYQRNENFQELCKTTK
jgi:hypothetical protein